MLTSKIETLNLDIVRHYAAMEFDRHGLPTLQPEFIQEYIPERMVQRLVANLKLPAQVLQDRRVLASYPATLWDYIKRAIAKRLPWLGLTYRTTEVRLTEHLIYPTVRVPEPYAKTVRLAVMPEIMPVIGR